MTTVPMLLQRTKVAQNLSSGGIVSRWRESGWQNQATFRDEQLSDYRCLAAICLSHVCNRTGHDQFPVIQPEGAVAQGLHYIIGMGNTQKRLSLLAEVVKPLPAFGLK